MMRNGRFLGRCLRPQRVAWTLMMGMVLLLALASANEFAKQQVKDQGNELPVHKIHVDYCHG